MPDVEALIDHYQNLTRASVVGLERLYAPDAYFKDPFIEVTGLSEIQRIFRHVFDQVLGPRLTITERVVAANDEVLMWDFSSRMRLWQGHTTQLVHDVSHLRFDARGRVVYHRDYWDAAEELYAKLPLLGSVIRGMQRALGA